MSTAIASRIRTVQPHLPQGAHLRFVPIIGRSHDQPPYALLTEQTQKSVQITETSTAGNVPELCVVNELDVPLLLIDGQELVGAKQNRILNTDVLVPPKRGLIIPVSCVEQGRWRHISQTFASGKSASHRVRSAKAQRVHESLRRKQTHDADQSQVWENVASSLHASVSSSPTMALSDAYAQRRRELERVRSQLEVPEDAVGLAVFHRGRFAGLDLFDRAATLRHFWETLVDSYAIDFLSAVDEQGDVSMAETEAVGSVLARASVGTWETFKSPGDGEDWRLDDAALAGSALVWENQTVLHLQLFPRGAQGIFGHRGTGTRR